MYIRKMRTITTHSLSISRRHISTVQRAKDIGLRGDITKLISSAMPSNTACEMIDDIRTHLDYTLETDKQYIWQTMLNLCYHHKLPEIYSNSIWKDIQHYHKQNKTQVNAQCLSSLVLCYANSEHFKEAMAVLHWLDHQYNVSDKPVILTDKVYVILLSKINKLKPNRTFNQSDALKAIKYIHLHLMQYNITNTRVYNALIAAYGQFGDTSTAKTVFDALRIKQTDSYNAMIGAYAMNLSAPSDEIMQLYTQMKQNNITSDHVTYLFVIKACGNNLDQLVEINEEIQRNGYSTNIKIVNTLIDSYTKCGNVDLAKLQFDAAKPYAKDNKIFKTMIKCMVESERCLDALALYNEMKHTQDRRVVIDDFILTHAIKACANKQDLNSIREDILRNKTYDGNVKLLNALMTQYGALDDLSCALSIFKNIECRDSVSYLIIMNIFAENARFSDTISLYNEMKQMGMKHNVGTYLVALKACASLTGLTIIHQDIMNSKLNDDVKIQTRLMEMYAKHGDLQQSYHVFKSIPKDKRSIVTYTTMMRVLRVRHCLNDAMRIYHAIKQQKQPSYDESFVLETIKCCGKNIANVESVHQDIQSTAFKANVKVLSALVTQYIAVGEMERAQYILSMFDDAQQIVNAAILGLKQMDDCEDALLLYDKMKRNKRMDANDITYILAIRSCQDKVEKLMEIDDDIRQSKYATDTQIKCCLMKQYATCGDVRQVQDIMNSIGIEKRDEVVYKSMLQAMALLGDLHSEIITLYNGMKRNAPMYITPAIYRIVIRSIGDNHDLENLNVVYADISSHNNYCNHTSLMGELFAQYNKCGDINTAKDIDEKIQRLLNQ
eukprot:229967_1